MLTAAVVQAEPVWLDAEATATRACDLIAEAAAAGARIVAFPESFIPAFPYGVWHQGLAENAGYFKRLFACAVEVGGPVTVRLAEAARAAGMVVVMGVTERAGGSLYNTQLVFDADGSLVGHRRKIKPTNAERLVWGEGDGSGLRVWDTAVGRVGALMCGEHNFALARYALQAQGEEIHVASYPDPLMEGRGFADRLEAAVRHYAAEGQCFVLNATGFIDDAVREAAFTTPAAREELADPRGLNGASSIIAPSGAVLAGPLSGRAGMITASIDLDRIVDAKYWFDSSGHSGRPDLFRVSIDFGARAPFVNAPFAAPLEKT
jgi:aliphatic nitrilase